MKRCRILIVEDEALIAADLADALEHLGFEITDTVGTAVAARAAFVRERPDLVLLDVNLRGTEDGVDVATTIRTHGATPIIFLTAQGDERTLARAEAVEPAGYLIKPFDERTLNATVRMALYRSEAEQARQEQRDMLSAAADRFSRALLGIDGRGIVRLVNALAADGGAVVGMDLPKALAALDREDLGLDIVAAVRDPAAPQNGFALTHTDGGYVVLIGAAPETEALCLCAWCRKARAKDGQWSSLEQVLHSEHNTPTTHGICEACARDHFANFAG